MIQLRYGSSIGECAHVGICRPCIEEMTGNLDWRCPYCHLVQPANVRIDGRCNCCRGHKLHFDRAVAVGNYQGILRDTVLMMKGRLDDVMALNLGRLLGVIVRRCAAPPFDVVIPVPLHWRKRWRRSFNLAAVIAEGVQRECGWPIDENALQLVRATDKQGLLTTPQRFLNVRGAYCLARGLDVAGRRVLVIDDVMTSGATLSEISRVVRCQGGAAAVWVGVVARGARAA